MEPRLTLDELQREMHQRIYRFVMQLRFVIAPLPAIVGGYVVIADPTAWRRVTLLVTLTLAALLSVVADIRTRRQRAPSLERVLIVVGVALQPIVLLATGGIVSPVLLAMLMVCFVASTFLARRTSGFVVAVQTLSLATASALEYLQPFGSLVPIPFRAVLHAGPSPTLLLIFTSVAALLFFVTREVGYRIQQAFAEIIERMLLAREESLRLHREQLAELTLLSGEIAHELKNPLASIKGLAALMARREEGPVSEPLVVLRREVDRMQRILEEFLNFSRPLVPLQLKPIDLSRIAIEVAAMHDGLSELRGVSITVAAEAPVEVPGDARKIRQILVNLLQNAIEASSANAHISIRVRATAIQAEVAIEDEGNGIEPSVAGRVFEAGVTSKGEGSGLGLNVARGLARQHGGDVTLNPRPPHGCVATLWLPHRAETITPTEVTANASDHSLPTQQGSETP